MNRAAQFYDFSLAAGASMDLPVEGGYYRIMSATGALRVRRNSGSQLGPLYPGQGERQEFNRLTLTDVSGFANTGYVLVADDSFVDERITGEVSVVDGEVAKSKAGSAFFTLANPAAVAGQNGYLELWNPVSSTKRAILHGFLFSANVASGILVQRTNATLGAALNGYSKLAGGAQSALVYGSGTAAAISGVLVDANYLQVASPLARNYKQPFIIMPGTGIVIYSTPVNISPIISAEFTEELI